jgi:hypothetical protein
LQKKFLNKNQMITLQPDRGVHKLVRGQVRSLRTLHHVKSWNSDMQVLLQSGQREQRFHDLHIGVDIE